MSVRMFRYDVTLGQGEVLSRADCSRVKSNENTLVTGSIFSGRNSLLMKLVPAVALDYLAVGPVTAVHNKSCPNGSDHFAARARSLAIRAHRPALSRRFHPAASRSDSASRFLAGAPRRFPLDVDKPGAG